MSRELPARPDLDQYKKQAKELLRAWKSDGRADAILADAQLSIARNHGFESWPKFVHEIESRTGESPSRALWRAADRAIVAGDLAALQALMPQLELLIQSERPRRFWENTLGPDYEHLDPRKVIARTHHFETWDHFAQFQQQRQNQASPVARFEDAVDAIVAGDLTTLARLLKDDPELIRARSPRVHHSQLLHYVGANGVEGFRQHTPKNAVAILEMLLAAGAEVDAHADMYGGGSTTLGLLATSLHPERAGLQDVLTQMLIDRGAEIDAAGAASGGPRLLVNSCLANGRQKAARYLAAHGAKLDLVGAAGIGRLDVVKSHFGAGDARTDDVASVSGIPVADVMTAFTAACGYGHAAVVEYLLDRGLDVNARDTGNRNTIGLHSAAFGGYLDIVKLLLDRGADVRATDETWNAPPLNWALHAWAEEHPQDPDRYYAVVEALVAADAPFTPDFLQHPKIANDPRMLAALKRQ